MTGVASSACGVADFCSVAVLLLLSGRLDLRAGDFAGSLGCGQFPCQFAGVKLAFEANLELVIAELESHLESDLPFFKADLLDRERTKAGTEVRLDREPLLSRSLLGGHRQAPLADEGRTDALAVCGDLTLLQAEGSRERMAFQHPFVGRFPLAVAELAYTTERELAVFELHVGNLMFAPFALPLGLELLLLVEGDYQHRVELALAHFDGHVPASEDGGHALELLTFSRDLALVAGEQTGELALLERADEIARKFLIAELTNQGEGNVFAFAFNVLYFADSHYADPLGGEISLLVLGEGEYRRHLPVVEIQLHVPFAYQSLALGCSP